MYNILLSTVNRVTLKYVELLDTFCDFLVIHISKSTQAHLANGQSTAQSQGTYV